jgi:phosphoribosylglycinamide formyltransferase-1
MSTQKAHSIRLGIIGSSGGSALMAADHCLKSAGKIVEWVIITDRECGLEAWAQKNDYANYRLEYGDAQNFSQAAFEIFQLEKCQNILLFYTRRLAEPLISSSYVWNIHPSLLPAFPGLHGVSDALSAGVKIFGATLHKVDEGFDSGPIIAQVASPTPIELLDTEVYRVSFFQKVWLTLMWCDLFDSGTYQDAIPLTFYNPAIGIASPGLSNRLLLHSYEHWLLTQAPWGVCK